jgi:hypothetical protein
VSDPTDEQLVPVQFTQSELDVIFFVCLHDIGHPQAMEFELLDEGFEDLLRALTRIQEWQESLVTAGEPDVVSPE